MLAAEAGEAGRAGKRLARPRAAVARAALTDRTMAQTPSPIPVAVAEEGQRPLLEQNHGAAGAVPAS
jgi:hypothetical protein